MKAHNFASHRARFFHTKTDLQNSQEPHQINVSKKTTSKMIDGNSLPYYQDRRKRGLHPLFRDLRSLNLPRFLLRPKGALFYSVIWFWSDISNCDSSISKSSIFSSSSLANISNCDSSISSVTVFTFSKFSTC